MVDFNKKWSSFEQSKLRLYWISCLCFNISDLKLTLQQLNQIRKSSVWKVALLPCCFWWNLFLWVFISIYFSLNFISIYVFFLESLFQSLSLFAIAILVSMSNGGGRFSGFDSCLNNLATFVILSPTLGRGRGRSVWKTPRIS